MSAISRRTSGLHALLRSAPQVDTETAEALQREINELTRLLTGYSTYSHQARKRVLAQSLRGLRDIHNALCGRPRLEASE